VEETLEDEVFAKGDARPPVINVLNKIDVAPEYAVRDFDGVPVSAREGLNLDILRERIAAIAYPGDRDVQFVIPHAALGSLAFLRAKDRVEVLGYVEEGARVRGRLSPTEVAAVEAAGGRTTSASSESEEA